jgi:predicted nucleic acid-binding protein
MSADLPVAVLVDTNVLASAAMRDILIELALDDVIRLHWSPMIMAELRRTLLKRRNAVPARIDSLLAAMNTTLPMASVSPEPGAKLDAPLPDPDDDHVVLAALQAQCSLILTFNMKDFPANQLALEDDDLRSTHPDAFMVHMLTTQAPAILNVIRRILNELNAPPMTIDSYAANLDRSGLPTTSALLRHLLATK